MNVIFKKSVTSVIAGAVFLVAAASQAAQGAESKLFVIRTQVQTVHNEVQVAELKGFFEEEGVKIEYVGSVEGLSEIQMVAQGLIDVVTNTHIDLVSKARIAGVKVIAAAPGMVDNPDYPHVRYFAREGGRVNTLDDIVGKKVGIQGYWSCIDGYLLTYLNKRGIKGDVEWVVLPTGGQAEQALTQGLIDMTTSHPPFGSLAAKAGGNKQIASTWDIFHSPGAGLAVHVFSEDFIKAHPKEVRAFSRAMFKARKWNNANIKESVFLVGKALGLDPATIDEKLDSRWYSEDPGIAKEDIELWFDISEGVGYWDHGDIEPEDVYTNEFAPTEKL